MVFNSLRQTIYVSVEKVKFSDDEKDNKINKIITGCLMYKMLTKIISTDSTYDGGISNLSDSYAASFKSIVLSLKNKYISYTLMKREIEKNNITSFLNITLNQINSIYDLYLDKTEITAFSNKTFSIFMYNISKTTSQQKDRLEKIHNTIMCPIINYYINKYDIKASDLVIIDSSEVSNNPGKIIKFSINNISPLVIIDDIRNNRINIRKYLLNIEQNNNSVEITIK